MDYLAVFIELLKEKIGDKEITGNTDLRGLGIDSLDLVEIIMQAEEKFNIQFTNEELNNFQTVNDVVLAIKKKV
ncbi:MAG: phosphopantetheine-binding protein [Bacilli bacterium]|nr:phosphopantetheine-binding protein [Bacilli bacterium]